MQLRELKEQLVKKQLKPFYLFTGEEVAIMDVYIQKIADTAKAPIKRVDTVSSIFSQLKNNSILSTANCFVIRDDKEYTTQETVWAGMMHGSLQGQNIIILVYTNIDKRSKFYKQHTELIVEFEKLAPEVLSKYIRKEIGLPESKGEELAEICDFDYSRILLECDKIRRLADATGQDIERAYKTALEEKLIYIAPKDVIFEFVDAVCRREITHCFKLFQQLTAVGESPLPIINLLYNNMRAMLLVQGSGNESNVSEKTGLTPFQVKLAKEKGNKYTNSELVRAIRIIRETERGIKTGKIDSAFAVEYILCNIL